MNFYMYCIYLKEIKIGEEIQLKDNIYFHLTKHEIKLILTLKTGNQHFLKKSTYGKNYVQIFFRLSRY